MTNTKLGTSEFAPALTVLLSASTHEGSYSSEWLFSEYASDSQGNGLTQERDV